MKNTSQPDSASMDPEKTSKLPPARLGEILHDAPTPFAPQPIQQLPSPPLEPVPDALMVSVPTSCKLTTNSSSGSPTVIKNSPIARPNVSLQQRPVSTAPSIQRGKPIPKPLQLDTPTATRPNQQQQQQQRGKLVKRREDMSSPEKTSASSSIDSHRFGFDGNNETPSASAKEKPTGLNNNNIDDSPRSTQNLTTTHLLKSATLSPSSFPPLPLQTYLSLAISSPTSSSSPRLPQQKLESPYPPQHYGPPLHNPDDSAAIAIERITNIITLPHKLEASLWFGMLACLDSWLYMFTIMPLRFFRAVGVLLAFWWSCITWYLWHGIKPRHSEQTSSTSSKEDGIGEERTKKDKAMPGARRRSIEKHVSDLLPSHKADILRGLVIFSSTWVLMRMDASRMYHSIRGQNGIKLYVIYNVLEISDRLCSAVGQDIFECLFSKETLERGPDGRSKVLKPFGFFLMALAYNILHATCLFYQVITLNVAVNSYSNALLTLLLSVQFVEIKSTVFKKFEKENLFQLTLADVVERFQLWLMLLIIGSRNLVEVGVWSLGGADLGGSTGASVLPKSFTILPKWTGQVMGPFLLVLGSEMLVDWLKHAYITKFNNIRPVVYEKFLDVLCKDYYSHAFADQNLTKRLGLPVIPLACLFIRASLQTYHMFLATHVPLPIPSITTSLDESHASAATTDALANFDAIIRRALGRSSFGGNTDPTTSSTDDLIAAATLVLFFLGFFLVFLAVKLVLGIFLLGFARQRYKGMKERQQIPIMTGARRVGGFGLIEVTDDQRKLIYEDDPEGERQVREREKAQTAREMNPEGLEGVTRYAMVAKRIW
ncbi:hypothetical protein RUND412_005663 [Rhizina undulata]